MKEQKGRLENGNQKLQRDNSVLECRFNTLREEHSTTQNLVNVYKAELDELRNKYYENDRQLNNYDGIM